MDTDAPIDLETSPPYDHDLNPIAERAIGVTSTLACSMSEACNAPKSLWPHLIENAVNVHNSTISSCGSSLADPHITAHQRLTRVQPNIMDLATFGCMAVVLKPPHQRKKSELSSRGYVGKFLGRAIGGHTGQWTILANGSLVTNSSVQVDEECFPWLGKDSRHPLHPTSRPTADHASGGGSASVAATSDRDKLCALNLFSGAYSRSEGLTPRLKRQFGWKTVINVDNDPDSSGGWAHDLLNDELYDKLLLHSSRGTFDAIMVAFPCTTFSAARLFKTDPPGPPPIRSKSEPDGFDPERLDPKHQRELRNTTVKILVAARNSPKKTSIIFENPADRSIVGTAPYGDDTKEHGSIWATSLFDELQKSIPDSSTATFAYCRLGSDYQKYTTIWYTDEAGRILDQLNSPAYKCNHSSHPKVAGGRAANGAWASAAAAAYPAQFNARLAMAFTFARTGDPRPIFDQKLEKWTKDSVSKAPSASEAADDRGDALDEAPITPGPGKSYDGSPPAHFPNLDDIITSPAGSAAPPSSSPSTSTAGGSPLGRPVPPVQGRGDRLVRQSTLDSRRDDLEPHLLQHEARCGNRRMPSTIAEVDESPYDTYSPFGTPNASRTAEAEVASLVFDAYSPPPGANSSSSTIPVGEWTNVGPNPASSQALFPGHT